MDKRIEKLIFSLITKLKDIQEDDRLDNNANAGILTAFENALNQFFANLQADFIAHNLELHHSFTVGTNNTLLTIKNRLFNKSRVAIFRII